MSKEFIESGKGRVSVETAAKQQAQLAYFTRSELQKDINEEYVKAWANRKYRNDDAFINWVKTIFKTDNFLAFFKHYRSPNPSSKLISSRIKEPLSRVFFAEDSYFSYTIRSKEVEMPPELQDGFEEDLFDAMLYRHNDIVVHDLGDTNKPYRFFLDIDKVVSIETENRKITKLAYHAESNGIKGYAYMDAERFIFFDKDFKEISNEAHDLDRCPAEFISNETIGSDPVVRRSIFSYLRSDLEEYCFLKTLQRMSEPNGAIPIVTKLKTTEKKADGSSEKGLASEPMSPMLLGGRQSDHVDHLNGKGSVMQAGTVIDVPPIKKTDGSLDIDIVKNFINFFYTPIEALDYLNKRIMELEQNIIVSALGDYSEANEEAKNEMQVSKSYVSKEDKLRWLSNAMSMARGSSDFIMLALKYGKGSVKCDTFYGSDFFLETQAELFEMFNTSPNAIERKNILTRLAQSRNRFNKSKYKRETILYKLLPYASDGDFKTSITNGQVDTVTFQLQTRFSYWIAMFEANYGNILTFWEEMEASESEKLILTNNLLNRLIESKINIKTMTNGTEANSTPAGVQG